MGVRIPRGWFRRPGPSVAPVSDRGRRRRGCGLCRDLPTCGRMCAFVSTARRAVPPGAAPSGWPRSPTGVGGGAGVACVETCRHVGECALLSAPLGERCHQERRHRGDPGLRPGSAAARVRPVSKRAGMWANARCCQHRSESGATRRGAIWVAPVSDRGRRRRGCGLCRDVPACGRMCAVVSTARRAVPPGAVLPGAARLGTAPTRSCATLQPEPVDHAEDLGDVLPELGLGQRSQVSGVRLEADEPHLGEHRARRGRGDHR